MATQSPLPFHLRNLARLSRLFYFNFSHDQDFTMSITGKAYAFRRIASTEKDGFSARFID
jgi:hypothetical protein